jgi:hypothetical protein
MKESSELAKYQIIGSTEGQEDQEGTEPEENYKPFYM